MTEEDRIREEIYSFIKDGTKDHLEELSRILVKRDVGSDFLKDLCACLSRKNNVHFGEYS